jgi:hypothetical protein
MPSSRNRIEEAVEPAILLAFGDRWTATLLRAELLERGHEASRTTHVARAILTSESGRIRVLAVEHPTISARDRLVVEWFRKLTGTPKVVLLTGASADVEPGPWDRVLRRPITIGSIAEVITELAYGEPAFDAVECPSDMALRGFEVRLGDPWPMIRCARCRNSRHCERPHTGVEERTSLVALVDFAVQHDGCREATACDMSAGVAAKVLLTNKPLTIDYAGGLSVS